MTWTPRALSFRISSATAALSASSAEIATPAMSRMFKNWRSRSICPWTVPSLTSMTTERLAAPNFKSRAASWRPSRQASQKGEFPLLSSTSRLAPRSDPEVASPAAPPGPRPSLVPHAAEIQRRAAATSTLMILPCAISTYPGHPSRRICFPTARSVRTSSGCTEPSGSGPILSRRL